MFTDYFDECRNLITTKMMMQQNPPPQVKMPPSDPMTQMNTYRSYVTMLADPNAKDESKLKAAQEMSENFEVNIF